VLTDTDLLVLGAGAKGTAVALKAHLLNSLGLGSVELTLVEASRPAAAWLDGEGVSTSREVLAISPAKDVAFPYQSACTFGDAGAAIDEAALSFSWQRHLVERGGYGNWVDAGSPPVQRRVYGAYLGWVIERATDGVDFVRGRVARVSLDEDGERWIVDVAAEEGVKRYRCGAFVLTGPGVHRPISHDLAVARRVLDCDSGRLEIARVAPEQSSDIAIVGGGESALSCMEFVRALRPDARMTIYTPSLPMSRVESFVENRIFSNPDEVGWSSLDIATRRDFIARSDRGVFGPERIAAFAYDEHCSYVAGRVLHVSAAAGGEGVRVEYDERDGRSACEHHYVINCTGFDPLGQLRTLLSVEARAELERRVGPIWDAGGGRELAMGRFLEVEGLTPRLHMPGMAALSQGPGFANLGSLGVLGDRVLAPFGPDAPEARRRARERVAEVRRPGRRSARIPAAG
jgi:mycobactin lysine-N-oxygenase